MSNPSGSAPRDAKTHSPEHQPEELVSIADMQRRIMPATNLIQNFGPYEVFGGTLPLDSVGGDFYDFIDMARFSIDGRLGVVIADISGHGLSAAMLLRDFNTALYTGISFEAHYAEDTTPLLFQKLNRRMYRSSLANQFVSAFYGELRLDGSFHYVNAGHLSPLILRESGCLCQLDVGGAVLGAFRDPPMAYQVGEAKLEPGDLLVGYTDGIIEAAAPEGEEYGVDRLCDFVVKHCRSGVRSLYDRVMQDVLEFTQGAPQSDDRTLIVIRRRE